MPVNDLGYRKWEGEIRSPFLRWLTIATAGIKIVYTSHWIKRIMFVAWAPTLLVGGLFFAYEQFVEDQQSYQAVEEWETEFNAVDRFRRAQGFNTVRGILTVFSSERQAREVVNAFSKDPEESRGYVWAFILRQMLGRTQGGMVLVLIGLIAPPLISRDIRSRAFLFYFSKPISRWDYLFGKLAVIVFFVGFVTILPALALYLFGVMLSPSLSVVFSTWYLPFQVILACLVAIIPACLIGLTLSSLTSESRFAGFAWFMVWILGFVGYKIIDNLQRISPQGMDMSDIDSYWRLLSLYDCLGYLQGWVMGLEPNHSYAFVLLCFVVGICVFCVFTIMRNISAPLKA